MFKKDPQIKALSNLKNSERKKVQSQCQDQTKLSSYAFPSQVIKQTTFKTQFTTGTVYTDEAKVPIWFKEKFSDMLYPTVYTCWKWPNLLPIVLAHEYVVEEKVAKGANLMLPGTVPPFDPRCVKTQMVGIASTHSPTVVKAIGIVQLNLPEYSRVIGESGVAVEITHTWDDGLCRMFKVKIEPPEVGEAFESQNEDSEPDGSETLEQSNESDGLIGSAATNPSITPPTPAPTPTPTPTPDVDLQNVAEQLTQLQVEDVDRFFARSLYYTLTQEPKLELPLSSSSFLSNHILRNLPPVDPAHVNMKKTSWRKTAKFLKHFEREGFLKLKGKGDDLTVIGVASKESRPELVNFVPYRVGSPNTGNSESKQSQQQQTMMTAVTLYKPISSAKEFLRAADMKVDHLFTQQELKAGVDRYITQKNLVSPDNKAAVRLDDLLFSVVNRATKKENAVRTIARASIMPPILKGNFSEHFVVLKPDGSPLFKNPLKGSIPRIEIVTEMKIGRKVVTKVSNFEKFQVDAQELAELLRKKCSGSTTIGETTTSPKTLEVTVQGPHGPATIDLLNDQGIPTKWINFVNKLKKGKKRG
ncbi:LANO_0C06546g1_1 [Lachancea nothofagi CBS 11611]|uniref:LANO_0C06546g1_1 n=1 Tax=Lachancea nothofagi CBS 11611 TaxID=1266666 RepID=A0A1G4J857_9SACH|nr:LANO_0C06546g1_1 [Lachancea nothofagi CBS 11611]